MSNAAIETRRWNRSTVDVQIDQAPLSSEVLNTTEVITSEVLVMLGVADFSRFQ